MESICYRNSIIQGHDITKKNIIVLLLFILFPQNKTLQQNDCAFMCDFVLQI